MSDLARAAAEAGTATRDRQIQEALSAFWFDKGWIGESMPTEGKDVTVDCIQECRHVLLVCGAHLDELARLIAQRDGIGEAMSDGPDVALNGWGSRR